MSEQHALVGDRYHVIVEGAGGDRRFGLLGEDHAIRIEAVQPGDRARGLDMLARRIGRPSAIRAVGLANGRNPISLIVPCHRVIGGDGSLTGYGGGIERKRFLLELEGARTMALPAG